MTKKNIGFYRISVFAFLAVLRCNGADQPTLCQDPALCSPVFVTDPAPPTPPHPALKPLPSSQPAQFSERLDNGLSRDYPGSILARDVNEDGHPDIIELSFAHWEIDKKISIFLWDDKTKTFAPPVFIPLSIAGNTQFLESADFDQDGHIDLAVLSGWPSELQILRGDGAGNFSFWKSVYGGPVGIPWIFALGHFNKADSESLDFVIFTYNGYSKDDETLISIISQDGKGNYGAPNLTYIPGGLPNQGIVGDVNEDGISDIMVAISNTEKQALFLPGDGIGGLLAPKTISLPEVPYAIALGPWQKGSHGDLAFIQNNTFYVVPGDGTGNFGMPVVSAPLPKDIFPLSLKLVDLNQDGNLDAVFPEYVSGKIMVLYGKDGGIPQPAQLISTGANATVIDVADLNSDNKLDFVVGTESATYGVVYQNDTGDGFKPAQNFGIASASLPAIVSDNFRKGSPELAIVDNANQRLIIWPAYDGKLLSTENFYRAFTPFVHVTGIEQALIATGNLNPKQDQLPDVVLVEQAPGKEHVQIHMSNLGGSYYLIKKGSYPLLSKPLAVTIADFTLDQNPDILVLEPNGFSLLEGKGDGTFAAPAEIPIAEFQNPNTMTLGDLDRDGALDIIVGNQGKQNMILFLSGMGGRTKQNPLGRLVSLATPFVTKEIALADMNQDNMLDMVITYPAQHQGAIFLQKSDGSFTSQTWAVDSEPGALALGDLNRDGVVDIVVTHPSQNTLTLLLGKGDGSVFNQKQTIFVGEGPSSIVMRDFDSDGALDLAVTNQQSRTVSFLYNQTPSLAF